MSRKKGFRLIFQTQFCNIVETNAAFGERENYFVFGKNMILGVKFLRVERKKTGFHLPSKVEFKPEMGVLFCSNIISHPKVVTECRKQVHKQSLRPWWSMVNENTQKLVHRDGRH